MIVIYDIIINLNPKLKVFNSNIWPEQNIRWVYDIILTLTLSSNKKMKIRKKNEINKVYSLQIW